MSARTVLLAALLLCACGGAAPVDPEVQAGRLEVETRACGTCHTGAAGTLAGSDNAPNLTPDPDTGLGSWTDQQIIDALKWGTDDEGATLCSRMPRIKNLSDASAKNIVAYLRALKPVANEVTGTGCQPTQDDLALHGDYVARQRGCSLCHGPDLVGSAEGYNGRPVFAPNLTPDPDTGLGSWTTQQIAVAIQAGLDNEGKALCDVMPRFTELKDPEVTALVTYLKTLTQVMHSVPQTMCDGSEGASMLGKSYVAQRACASCHGEDLGGNATALPNTQVYGPNLTPDVDTGLGSWSAEQIIRALRLGVDDEGATLCSDMPRFTMTDDEANAVASYLKGLTAISRQVPESQCGGMMTTCMMTPAVVIAQVYGGGGNTGAVWNADFVELHNRSNAEVDISTWSLQYASASGTSWTVATFPAGTKLPAGAFLLVAAGPVGTHGAALPASAVHLSRTIDFAAGNGKVALVSSATALSGACPGANAWVDLVGYGMANCSDGASAAPPLSATLAALRADAACGMTHVNATDFAAAAPAPHGAGASVCSCP